MNELIDIDEETDGLLHDAAHALRLQLKCKPSAVFALYTSLKKTYISGLLDGHRRRQEEPELKIKIWGAK